MERYVKLIDGGESVSTDRRLNYNGIPANYFEWEKYDFYPQTGMVGRIVPSPYQYTMVEIDIGKAKMYVPMTERGLKDISEQEYIDSKYNNINQGIPYKKRHNRDTEDAIVSLSNFTKYIGKNRPVGLEFDKRNYCVSFKQSFYHMISTMGYGLYEQIDNIAENMKKMNMNMNNLTYQIRLQKLGRWIKESVSAQGWGTNIRIEDERNGIVWIMGIYVKAYRKAMGPYNDSDFDKIFQDLYEYYYYNL